jgi:eukaryotic-like serine/threonine-protein kinase
MSGDARGDFSGSTVGGGRYQLRSLLGEGGMASVHMGHDTVLDRPVAIKTLHSELGREASFRERFRREAQAVARLNHTNIVSVFDSGEDEIDGRSVPYIVMELVDGDPLRDVLDRDVAEHGAMPTDKALKITGDVLAALAASHEMGLVHRDIKPGNVMLTRRGVVKVMDFGIARALQSGVTSMTQTGMVVGTPQYLSPEQALGRGVDARSDLYSVGCMLFELLTGRLPFDGDSPLSVAYQHVQTEPPVPSGINRSLPPAVDALVARALKKDPGDRFPSAEAMQDECQRVASGSQAATPLVISEGPKARHGQQTVHPDSFAVFPNAASGADPHTPYQQQLHTPPPSGYGPPTPPPNQMPQQQYPQMGYPTPPPMQQQQMQQPMGRPVAPGYPRPPQQQMKPRSGGNWKPLVIFASIALVAAVILIIIVGSLTKNSSDDYGDDGSGGYSPTPAASQTVAQGDQSQTIDADLCTDAIPGEKAGTVSMPDMKYDYVDSVVQCITEAGWSYTEKPVDEALMGKGTVMSTQPDAFDNFDPKTTKITLYVSTGVNS